MRTKPPSSRSAMRVECGYIFAGFNFVVISKHDGARRFRRISGRSPITDSFAPEGQRMDATLQAQFWRSACLRASSVGLTAP